jgi:hypothetical protein
MDPLKATQRRRRTDSELATHKVCHASVEDAGRRRRTDSERGMTANRPARYSHLERAGHAAAVPRRSAAPSGLPQRPPVFLGIARARGAGLAQLVERLICNPLPALFIAPHRSYNLIFLSRLMYPPRS